MDWGKKVSFIPETRGRGSEATKKKCSFLFTTCSRNFATQRASHETKNKQRRREREMQETCLTLSTESVCTFSLVSPMTVVSVAINGVTGK